MNVRTFLPTLTLCFFALSAAAQSALPDSSAHYGAEDQVISRYNQVIGDQAEIYNGPRYYLLPRALRGSPYFLETPTFQPAVIRYNGTSYSNVPVLYDAFADVMASYVRDVLYTFRTDRLTDVYLAGHHFVYMDASKSLNLTPGYYDQLYGGSSEVVVKRSRGVVNRAGSQGVETFYENHDDIYIRKGKAFVPVNSKGSVLKVFKDKADRLKQYLSGNKIAYRKDKEGSIEKLAAYYDKLSL
ncbi:MAG TPA: hypothetical protein VG367_14340 [Mucilaginibacter sp.]|jgi:hypothetical protein|nr:hypothetical protein [Mucilaginibacter sp.]